MKHYRIIETFVYSGSKIIGSYYCIQKRYLLFFWKTYEAVPDYQELNGIEAARYELNRLENAYKAKAFPKHKIVKYYE